MTARPILVLASASPARLRTLRAGGVEPEVVVSGVDESIVESTSAQTLCATLARLKAEAVVARLRLHPVRPGTLVLGCDSVLEFAGQLLGKPADEAEATRRWQALRGNTGILHTGHCLVDVETGKLAEEATRTIVYFADITDEDIAAYVASGEPMHVAGAFTIDGVGGWFIDRIDGDAGTVIGVSLPAVRRLLGELGTSISAFWAAALPSPE